MTDLIEVIEPINSKLTLLGGGKAPFYVYDGHQLSLAKLPPGMPDYSRISSSSRTRNRELLFGSDFGQIFVMDPDLQRVRSIPVGNGFIGRVVQDGAHLLANSITQVHQVPWPSPWSILEPLDRAGSAGFTAMSISDAGCFLHSDGGSFELKPLPGQAPLFEHKDWSASGEGAYDTMLLGQSRLIATDHELLLFTEQLPQVIDAQGYVREFYPDRFDSKIVWMASEWGIRALRTGHAQSRLGLQLSQPLPSERDSKLLSLAQMAPNEIYGTTKLHGLRRYRFTEAGAVEVLETIPLDAKIWQPQQDLYVQFDPNTQSLMLSTLAGIFRLTEQGAVLDPRFANLRAQNHRAEPLQLVFDQQNILAHNQLKLFAYRVQTTQSNALQSESLTFQALEMPLSRLSAIIDVKLISPLQAFVLTNESLMALDLAGLQAPEMQPQESLRFTAVSKIDAGNQYALVPLQPAALTLQQNDLGARFEFALSGLHEPGSVQFRGKLVGYEPAFSPWAQSASYTYTRLRPGPYALQIEARDKFGKIYSAPEFALVFSPKWHDHVGTRAIALLVFASLLALLLRTAVRRRTLSLQRLIDAKTMELAGANRTLADLANLDALTGIANRRKLDSYFNAVWESARLSEHSLALLLIDADRFKQYNDAHGHAAGDELLKKLAKLIAHKLRRAEDLFARYGGEEFVVLMPGASAEIAKDFAEQIRASVESAALGATISIGVASLQVSSALAPHILFERADSALYQAKAQGRNCIRCYGSELTRNS